jgi:hypothetical protein
MQGSRQARILFKELIYLEKEKTNNPRGGRLQWMAVTWMEHTNDRLLNDGLLLSSFAPQGLQR